MAVDGQGVEGDVVAQGRVAVGEEETIGVQVGLEACGSGAGLGGGAAGTVWIRDLLTGETCCVLRGHTGYWITGIGVMTVDARTLLVTSGGADRTVRIWDPGTGQCALTIPVHHEVVGSAQVGDGLLAVAVPSGVLVYRIRAR